MGPTTPSLPLRYFRSGILNVLLILSPVAALATTLPQDTTAVRDTTFTPLPEHTAWTSHSISRDELLAYPSQELSDYLELIPGVTKVDGQIHFRGARQDAVFYGLDGFSITNPVTNSPILTLIPEAVGTIDVHTGPYGAMHGRSTGGLVLSSMRKGGDSFGFTASARTDELARPGEQLFGTTVQGYRRMALTVSGPIVSGIRFFVAGEHRFAHNRQPMFLEPFRFDSLRVDRNDLRYDYTLPDDQQELLPGSVVFRRNYVPSNSMQRNTVQGNIAIDIRDATLFVLASHTLAETQQGGWPWVRENFYRQSRVMTEKASATFMGLRLTHQGSPRFRYSIAYGYSLQKRALVDPHFGEDWRLYTDSLANAQKGFLEFRRRYYGAPNRYSTIFALGFQDPNYPNTQYEKYSERSHQFSFSGEAHPFDWWSIRLGAAHETWQLRRFTVTGLHWLMASLYGYDGSSTKSFQNEAERHAYLINSGGMRLYGFDPDGNEIDSGPLRPYEPEFSSAYMENVLHHGPQRLTIGIRYERYHPRLRFAPDEDDPPFLPNLSISNDALLLTTVPFELYLPRVAWETMLTPAFYFHVTYGKYAQFPQLQRLLTTARDRNIYTERHYGVLDYPAPAGAVRPERSSHLEAGVVLRGSDERWTIAGSAFRKWLPSQLRLAEFDSSREQLSTFVYESTGEALISGVEATISVHPSQRLMASVRYTYTDTRGTETSPTSTWASLIRGLAAPPEVQYPLGYERIHQLHLIAGLRFLEEDGPILGGLSVSVAASLLDGRKYTRSASLPRLSGHASPWNVGSLVFEYPFYLDPIDPPNTSSAPGIVNIDLHISKSLCFGPVRASIVLDILNLFNRRDAENVYPFTGSPDSDGWSGHPYSQEFQFPRYHEAYQILNDQNREAYMKATGVDIYRPPRQVRVGVRVEM